MAEFSYSSNSNRMSKSQRMDRLQQLLKRRPARASTILQELEVSQPTFSRLWATVRDGVVLGASEARQYALRRHVPASLVQAGEKRQKWEGSPPEERIVTMTSCESYETHSSCSAGVFAPAAKCFASFRARQIQAVSCSQISSSGFGTDSRMLYSNDCRSKSTIPH